MSRTCETCYGRGSVQTREIEEDENNIEMETLTEKPCPDCNASGEAKFDPEKDGDYDI